MMYYMKKIKNLDKIYLEYEEDFIKSQVDKTQIEILTEVNLILDYLNIGNGDKEIKETGEFLSWTGEKLINAQAKLSRYSENLDEHIHHHSSRSDFAYIWRKGQMAQDWQPTKVKLNNELGKATVKDIENKTIENYLGEQFYSLFHRKRADLLIGKVEAIDRMLRAIANRLKQLEREKYLKHNQ